jgi:hypothetical protein
MPSAHLANHIEHIYPSYFTDLHKKGNFNAFLMIMVVDFFAMRFLLFGPAAAAAMHGAVEP